MFVNIYHFDQNFINAASFARRLLELPDINSERHADTRVKAQKVLQKSEQQGRNEFAVDYDEMNPFRSVLYLTLKILVLCNYISQFGLRKLEADI